MAQTEEVPFFDGRFQLREQPRAYDFVRNWQIHNGDKGIGRLVMTYINEGRSAFIQCISLESGYQGLGIATEAYKAIPDLRHPEDFPEQGLLCSTLVIRPCALSIWRRLTDQGLAMQSPDSGYSMRIS